MTYDENLRRFRLSSGRTFNGGASRAIGLDDGEISVGFDALLVIHEDGDEPTLEEKVEIAEYIIAQWTTFRNSLTG